MPIMHGEVMIREAQHPIEGGRTVRVALAKVIRLAAKDRLVQVLNKLCSENSIIADWVVEELLAEDRENDDETLEPVSAEQSQRDWRGIKVSMAHATAHEMDSGADRHGLSETANNSTTSQKDSLEQDRAQKRKTANNVVPSTSSMQKRQRKEREQVPRARRPTQSASSHSSLSPASPNITGRSRRRDTSHKDGNAQTGKPNNTSRRGASPTRSLPYLRKPTTSLENRLAKETNINAIPKPTTAPQPNNQPSTQYSSPPPFAQTAPNSAPPTNAPTQETLPWYLRGSSRHTVTARRMWDLPSRKPSIVGFGCTNCNKLEQPCITADERIRCAWCTRNSSGCSLTPELRRARESGGAAGASGGLGADRGSG